MQHAEQLDLEFERGGVDFVEENGAGVGRLETAGAIVDSTRKGPANMAEQLAFEERFGERAAIDLYERAAGAGAEVVNRAGDKLLAGAGFAEQQHRGLRRRHASGEFVNPLHRRARSDHTLERGAAWVGRWQRTGHRT